MSKMEQVEYLWDKYNDYKETAEQHEFVKLLFFDVNLNPGYKDLHENYCDEHADIFIRCLTNVLNNLGVKL